MARRWLLTLLTGTALSVGLAGAASAQELGDPLVVDAEVATATITADAAEQSLGAELTTDASTEQADTTVEPTATVEASPDGPTLDTGGTVEVVGTDVPLADADEVVDPDPAPAPAPAPADGPSQSAAGNDIGPAPAPAGRPAPAGDEPRTVRHSDPRSADSAAVRAGLRAETAALDSFGSSELVPVVAPPAAADEPALVAAAAPPAVADLALPIIDPTATVPGVLRLLAGLLVLGAAVTWRTVRDELA
ncbi:MAG: hypothetical protein KY461_01995 [Actinobacteria bacterium]|nr:hypothetical protein [Actinomycetota bacterium]